MIISRNVFIKITEIINFDSIMLRKIRRRINDIKKGNLDLFIFLLKCP